MLSKITLATVVFFCISLEGKKRVRVELNDGAVIESILLKSTDQFIFLDLDFEVLKIPQKEVSAINELNHSEPTPHFPRTNFFSPVLQTVETHPSTNLYANLENLWLWCGLRQD